MGFLKRFCLNFGFLGGWETVGEGVGEGLGKGQKKHINFFNVNFLHPPQNTPFWAPRKKKLYVHHFQEKTSKKGTHINFFGATLGVKKGGPKRAIWGHNKSSLFSSCPYWGRVGEGLQPEDYFRNVGTKIEHINFIFSNFSGPPRISRPKSRDIPPRSLVSGR